MSNAAPLRYAETGWERSIDLPTIELTADEAMLAAVVERTDSVESFRFAMLMEMSVPNEGTVRIEADGAVESSGDISMEMQLKGDGGAGELDLSGMAEFFGSESIELVQSGNTAYMKAPGLTSMMGSDAEWIALPVEASSELTFGMEMGSPTSYFDDLPDGVTVTELGQETVGGVSTTKFAVGLADLATGDATVDAMFAGGGPMLVWIDDMGLLRRVEMSFDLMGLTGGLVIETFDFGADVDVNVPGDYLTLDPSQFGY